MNNKIFYPQSDKLLNEARSIIPSLTQTLSKGPQVYGYTADVPHYIQKSSGVYAYDVDGNCFIDYSMGLGSVILGHAYPEVTNEVYRAICDGNSHSMMHPIEIELSKKVLNFCPWADMVRFGKNGSDTITAAIRLARAYTGRKYIAVATNYDQNTKSYHGWHDWSAALSEMNAGIPEEVKKLTLTFDFNSTESLENLIDKYGNDIAGIVMEGAKFSAPTKEFVQVVNEICEKTSICLIIDETLNGLRMAPGGAHEKFLYKPDLVTYGKSFGNGFPLSILVGKKRVMEQLDNILFTMTYGGETSSLVAANCVIDIYQDKEVFKTISHHGNLLKSQLQELLVKFKLTNKFIISGLDTRFRLYPCIEGSNHLDVNKAFSLRKILFKNGILCAGVHNMALLHNKEIVDSTIERYINALKEIK